MNVHNDVSKFSASEITLFAKAEWASMYGDGILPIAVGNDAAARAVLNVLVYKKLGKVFLINPPFAPNCGLSIAFNSNKRYSIHTEVKRVIRTLSDYLNKEFSSAYIDISFPPEIKDIQPFLLSGFTPEVAYTYRLNIDRRDKELLAEFSSERRKNVRDAEKAGLRILFNSESDDVVKLVKDTLQRSGLKYDSDILRKMLDAEWTYTVSIYNEFEMLATAVIAYDSHCAYYIAGGTVKGLNNSGAGAMALWESIRKARELKIETFDFCGSSVPSIENFFRGFGGELTPYFRIKNNFMLFDLLKSTKRKIS